MRADADPLAIRTVLRVVDVLPFLYLIGFTVLLTARKGGSVSETWRRAPRSSVVDTLSAGK